ncbi:MAG: pyruvate kinase [Xanthobacteraceae bacterium]
MKPSLAAKAADSALDINLNHKYLHFRRTKIIATVGPASNSPQMLRKLIAGGVNVIRINFSHGNPEDHMEVMRRIRQISAQLKTQVAILADLCGPKVRVGKFKGDAVMLKDGSTVWITTEAVLGTETLIPSQYRGLIREARVGDPVLLDDGNLELKVIRKVGGRLQAKVVRGGLLKNNKGMNLPSTPMNIAALTDKDRRDVGFAVRGGADYVALSFVRNPQDILDLRRRLKALKAETPIIAKIEKPEALRNIRDIVDLADGIMVARGDLGVELPARKVPIIQNKLIAIANKCKKPVIVATQMLESMIEHSRPTRAEVTDVAAACAYGADAVMMSAETASGKYPLEALQAMDAILRETEAYQFFAQGGHFYKADQDVNGEEAALGKAAAQLSRDLMVCAVFVTTESGHTARMVSSDRPAAPILAFTPSQQVARCLQLVWGVYPFVVRKGMKAEDCLAQGVKILRKLKLATTSNHVLMVSIAAQGRKGTSSVVVHRFR